MKTCFKCLVAKPLSEFYPHKQMGDKHLNKCKDCTKADSHKRHLEKCNDPEWLKKERARHRAKTSRYRAAGIIPSKAAQRRGSKKWAALNRHKKNAFLKVRRAIIKGILIPQPCEKCGETKVQGHHDNYDHPLSVRWLCTKHNGEARRKDKLNS